MYRPMTARFEGAAFGAGFSTIPFTRRTGPGQVDVEDPVGRGLRRRDFHRRHHASADLGIGLDHLLEAGLGGRDHVVGQDHREGLVADEALRAPDRVPEAKRLVLADVGDGARVHVRVVQHLEEARSSPSSAVRFRVPALGRSSPPARTCRARSRR
jgi:hypothetical protein